jgi:hyperosmotically inducible periplasmic protein
MHLRHTLTAIAISTGIAASMALTACAVNEKTPDAGVRVGDAAITANVKARFLDSPKVDGRAIHVQTLDGTVLLTGNAASHVEKATASEIALGVSGVRMVQNEITVTQ